MPTDTIHLRHSVLWPDKPMSYVCLPEDEKGEHLGAFVPTRSSPVGIISLFPEQLPEDVETRGTGVHSIVKAARFRKFACDPLYQGQGIGTLLMKEAFLKAKTELLADVVWCDARLSTAAWYEKRGMVPFGETFWKGHIQYIKMKTDV